MQLPALPNYQAGASNGSPRAAAGFRFAQGGASFRRTMTTVAMSCDGGDCEQNSDIPVELTLHNARYKDCDNPGPGTYNCSTGNSSNHGTAPMWSMGRKTWVERKVPGAKQSLEKTWFCSSDPWRQKVDGLFREEQWPEPASYRLRSMGEPDPTRPRPAGFRFNSRAGYDPERRRRLACPPPGAYEVAMDGCRGNCTLGHRRETRLWPPVLPTPGPGRYDNEKATAMATKAGRRRFTMRGPKERIDYSRAPLGPFFAF